MFHTSDRTMEPNALQWNSQSVDCSLRDRVTVKTFSELLTFLCTKVALVNLYDIIHKFIICDRCLADHVTSEDFLFLVSAEIIYGL